MNSVTHAGPLNAQGVASLAVKLARAALDLDQVITAITEQWLDQADVDLITSARAHIALLLDALDSAVLEVEAHGWYEPAGRPLLQISAYQPPAGLEAA